MPTTNKKHLDNTKQTIIDKVRRRLYDNIIPFSYGHPIQRVYSALVKNKPSSYEKMPDSGNYDALDEIYANYLQIPKYNRHYDSVLKQSLYKPSKATDATAIYYSLPLEDKEKQRLIKLAINGSASEVNTELGEYKLDLGEDEKGKYVSYYDSWDINPFKGVTSYSNKITSLLGLDKIGDMTFGIGKPVEIYDRIYYNDDGKIINTKKQLGGLVRRSLANGGSIHIKPSTNNELVQTDNTYISKSKIIEPIEGNEISRVLYNIANRPKGNITPLNLEFDILTSLGGLKGLKSLINWRPLVPRDPNRYYRIVGTAGDPIGDAIKSGVIRGPGASQEARAAMQQLMTNEPNTITLLPKAHSYPMFSKGKPWNGSTSNITKGKPIIIRSKKDTGSIIWEESNKQFRHKGHKGIFRPNYNGDVNAAPIEYFEYWEPKKFGYVRKDFK